MNDRSQLVRYMSLLSLMVATIVVWWGSAFGTPITDLQVTFIDVGQGDATLIQTPDGVDVLIDGGANSGVLRELSRLLGPFDRTIDVVVGTHPDKDHIGGLIDVFKRYDVASVLITENEGESAAAAAYQSAITAEGSEVTYARRGQVVQLGASTTLEVLFPDTNPQALESNTSSIILRLTYGETNFLLTGDAPKGIEEYLVILEGEHLQSDVLKIGHHGSRTSTSELFLAEVDPVYAVISAGFDNRYGHPHVEVTDLLFNEQIKTYSTAIDGSVTFVSDGSTVLPNTKNHQ